MKRQKEEKCLEDMKIYPNQTTMWLNYAFYKFIIDDSWGNSCYKRSSEKKWINERRNQGVNYCVPQIVSYEPHIASYEPHITKIQLEIKEIDNIYLTSRAMSLTS